MEKERISIVNKRNEDIEKRAQTMSHMHLLKKQNMENKIEVFKGFLYKKRK